jgi:hypothetical protein
MAALPNGTTGAIDHSLSLVAPPQDAFHIKPFPAPPALRAAEEQKEDYCNGISEATACRGDDEQVGQIVSGMKSNSAEFARDPSSIPAAGGSSNPSGKDTNVPVVMPTTKQLQRPARAAKTEAVKKILHLCQVDGCDKLVQRPGDAGICKAHWREVNPEVGVPASASVSSREDVEQEAARRVSPCKESRNAPTQKDTAWDKHFQELVDLYETQGDQARPINYSPLANWLKAQRYNYRNKLSGKNRGNNHARTMLSDEREEKLNSIGFAWDPRRSDGPNKKKRGSQPAALDRPNKQRRESQAADPKEDELKKEILSMLLSLGASTEVENSMKAMEDMWRVLDDEDDTRKELAANKIVELHGLTVIVSSVKRHLHGRLFAIYVIDCLVVITSFESEGRSKVFLLNVLDMLLEVVEQYPDCVEVRGGFVGLLYNISTCKESREEVAREKMIELVVIAMKAHPNDGFIQERGCAYFSEVMKVAGKQTLLKKRGAASIVSLTLENAEFNAHVHGVANKTLEDLFMPSSMVVACI